MRARIRIARCARLRRVPRSVPLDARSPGLLRLHGRRGDDAAPARRRLGGRGVPLARRRATLIASGAEPTVTGRIEHVSTRSVFVLEERWDAEPADARVRLVPFAAIDRIVGAESVESSR